MSKLDDLIKRKQVQQSDTVHDTVAPIIYNARTRENTEKEAKEGTERLKELRRQGKQAVFRPDYRTSDQRKRDDKEADYKHQQYQKAKDDQKRAEGFENLMKLTSPSTYVEAATGEQLTPAGKLATDMAIFGLAGGAKSLLTRGQNASKFIWNNGKIIQNTFPYNPRNWYRGVGYTALKDAEETGVVRGIHRWNNQIIGPYFGRGFQPHQGAPIIIEGTPESATWVDPFSKTLKTHSTEPIRDNASILTNKGKLDYSKLTKENGFLQEGQSYEGFPMTNGDVNATPVNNFVFYKKYPVIGWRPYKVSSASKSVVGEAKGIGGITPENAASITPQQWTAAQDATIAKGDMAEAQRLRDLHFKVSAPSTQIKDIQYHGAKGNAIFNVFDPKLIGQTDQGWAGRGYYFTPSKDYAKMYGSEPRAFYINAQKVHDGTASTYFGREDSPAAHAFKIIRKKHGDDGQQILDDLASSDAIRTSFSQTRPYNGIFEEVVTRNNNQMKLADAVTYDNNGVRIPLGERDNFNISDIRYFSQQPVVRANPVHTATGNPLATRLARLRDHYQNGFISDSAQEVLVKPNIHPNEIRSIAKQIDSNLTEDQLDQVAQIAMSKRNGVHIPIQNDKGTVNGVSIVDVDEAINWLKQSGITPDPYHVGIIAGHEAGHGVQVSPAARRLVEGFAEPDEFYTRAGQVLDAAGITATADNPVTYNKFVNLIDKYLKQGNLDNGVSELKQFMIKLPPLERQKVMKYINRLSAGTGLAYLTNE